jgi:adenine phosphoribosyltransferase
MNLKKHIREIPNWPKKGITFYDITTLLQDQKAFKYTIDEMAKPFKNKKVDKVVGIDARGFLFASAMAYKLKTGLAIVRKKGKLPHKTFKRKYSLEYAADSIEMHRDSIMKREKVLLVDDVLATGGTMRATIDLVEKMKGNIVGISFLSELDFLKGRKKIKNNKVNSLIKS